MAPRSVPLCQQYWLCVTALYNNNTITRASASVHLPLAGTRHDDRMTIYIMVHCTGPQSLTQNMIICSSFTSWLGYAETVWDTQNGKNEIIETLIKSFYGDHFFLYQIMLKTGNRKSSKVSRFTGPAFDKYVKLVELLQYQFHGSWHYRRNSNNSVYSIDSIYYNVNSVNLHVKAYPICVMC